MSHRASRVGPSSRLLTGTTTENCARREPCAAGVVVIKQPAHHLSGGVQPANRLIGQIEEPRLGINTYSAEGEGDATGYRKCAVRGRIQALRPIGLRRLDTLGPLAILDSWIELTPLHSRVIGADRLLQCLRIEVEPLG